MTNLQTFKAIRALGLAVQLNDGEWQVDYRKGDTRRTENSRYYTDDRTDALGTAQVMAAWRSEECMPHAFELSYSHQEYICGKCGATK